MSCAICDRLAAEHERLQLAHSVAAGIMVAKLAEPSAFTFNTLRAAAEDARIDCEMGRLTLEQHKRIHSRAN